MMPRSTLLIWFFCIFLYNTSSEHPIKYKYPQEYEHNWFFYQPTLSPDIPGAYRPLPDKLWSSPDFREEEPVWLPSPIHRWNNEENRPYRVSPSYKMLYRFSRMSTDENIFNIGCYCTTVYKRFTLLAGCAVITTRHILTTASSTWLVIRDRLDYDTYEDVLGIWYDDNHDTWNTSMYMSPSRIHFHPLFHLPEHANRSHPFPFTYDLAVWATTHHFYGWYSYFPSTVLCDRATSSAWEHSPAVPAGEMYIIVGFQYIWAYKRKPMPWNKYMYRTFYVTDPCPKSEWGWFICIPSPFMKFGIDSGAGLHRANKGKNTRLNGLIALGAFSMQLRSDTLIHYFTVLDCHAVLDFLYDAYMGRQKYVWLDKRFEDTIDGAPKPLYHIPHHYDKPEQNNYFYLTSVPVN